ncbi:MAG: capsular biosynthesis protein [Pseudomonadota bacterium]
MADRKTFLFLQGHHSSFWVRLGDALKADGHEVRKIRLSGQDLVYWPRRGATSYRGSKARWRGWVAEYMRREGITDVLYYADRHPWNVDALAAAKDIGVRPWTIEFGYLRPDWLTLEPEAMGAFSRFPKEPAVIRRLGAARDDEPDPTSGGVAYPSGFWAEAGADIGMFASTITGWPLYPHYRLDLPYTIFTHYGYWIKTLFTDARDEREALAVQRACAAPTSDYTLFAMQLAQDYQIRASSRYDDYGDIVEEIFASFARGAPPGRRLVMKMHPLDNGYQHWRRRVPEMADRYGVSDRIDLIRGGDLGVFIRNAKGAVMANSTVGIHCLRVGVPVKALGEAVYDVPGLTHQGALDDFWATPEPVDRELEACFVRALAREIQIKGSFYNPEGRQRAIDETVERLTRRPYPDWAL